MIAFGNRATGNDDADLIAAQLRRTRQHQKVIHRNLAEAVTLICRTARGQSGTRFRAGNQAIDQPAFQGRSRGITTELLENRHCVLDYPGQSLDRHATMTGDDFEVLLPQPTDKILRRGTVGVGHRIADERLHRRLEFADPKQVDIDAQLFQPFPVVVPEVGITLDQRQAFGVEPDFVGQGREAVCALSQHAAMRDNRLSGLPEALEGCR